MEYAVELNRLIEMEMGGSVSLFISEKILFLIFLSAIKFLRFTALNKNMMIEKI